jgi:hypothetical protein
MVYGQACRIEGNLSEEPSKSPFFMSVPSAPIAVSSEDEEPGSPLNAVYYINKVPVHVSQREFAVITGAVNREISALGKKAARLNDERIDLDRQRKEALDRADELHAKDLVVEGKYVKAMGRRSRLQN